MEAEALKAGIAQDLVDAVDGRLGIGVVLVQFRDFCIQRVQFFAKLLAMGRYVLNLYVEPGDLILGSMPELP